MQLSRQFLFLVIMFFFFTGYAAEDQDTTLQRIRHISDPVKRVDAYNRAIEDCWRYGAYETGLQYADHALKEAQKARYRKGEGEVLNNIGIIYDYQGEFAKSLRSYFKALRIQEAINDQKGIAYTCSNIGLIYSNQRNFDDALRYHKRSLDIRKKLKFKPGISASYNNLGIVYMNQKKYKQALEAYFASVEMDLETGDERGIGDAYSNIGIIYMDQNDYAEAETYFLKSIEIRQKFDDQMGLSTSYNNLGTLYSKQHQWEKAKTWLLKGLDLGKKIGAKESIKYSYQQLSEVETEEGNYEAALNHYKLFIAYGDMIINEASTREQTQTEMQYKFDKKEAKEKLDQQRKDLLQKRERVVVQAILWSVVVLAVIVSIFSIFLYKRWKIAKEQKILIEEKNRLVQLKNEEILDSISYAKRIQSAILPPEKLVKEFLVNSFILYKPKDIVAGDFYWMEAQGDTIIFAAADCTGHGVPGALISVVCHNALNRSVREFGLIDPGAILDKTRDIIIEEFDKSEDDVNDGMDISLCALNSATMTVKWSGANNPLWVVRHHSNEVFELKANKQPIGKYSKYEAFDTHDIRLEKGDSLYLFTDGFADQFGGPDAKKYKSRNMKELILRVKDHPMEEQKRLFESAFDQWKGDLEQVDDVCVLGIRV
jgi:tetratricopeptide (TPR) repeat protein